MIIYTKSFLINETPFDLQYSYDSQIQTKQLVPGQQEITRNQGQFNKKVFIFDSSSFLFFYN